ncbi:MAG TPA: sensor domain-containing diguanylate cyclase [Gemmatimonadaceae bacterium]
MSAPSAPPPRASLRDPETLRQFIAKIQEGIYISNARGEILDANPAFVELFGAASLDELRAVNVAELLVDPARRQEEMALLARDGAVREFELQIVRRDGAVRTVLDTTYTANDAGTGDAVFHGIIVDITARKALEEQLRDQSVRDPLTGCYNRRHLEEVERELSAACDPVSWGCLFIDIDHFKQFNDEHGHRAGDQVLVRMSRFLARHVRSDEAVVRVGGDEFVIVLRDADAAVAERVARRLQNAALRTAPVPFSLGWAARQGSESLQKTIRRADQCLLAVRVESRAPVGKEGQ